MPVMNAVWPYCTLGRSACLASLLADGRQGDDRSRLHKPFWQSVVVGDTHCGAGCTVGDFIGEWVVFGTGFSIAGSVLWADYAMDFVFAYALGILFQYYAIAPMRGIITACPANWWLIRNKLKEAM